MSWADDTRCLFCDGRLPLYRKITNGQFCNSAHRKAYWKEQERLAVERLHQTHDSLHALRPPGLDAEIEAILGPAPGAIEQTEIPEFAQLPPDISLSSQEGRPWWITQINTGEVPVAELVPNALPVRPQWIPDSLAGTALDPFFSAHVPRRPANTFRLYDCGFAPAGVVEMRAVQIAGVPVFTRSDIAPLAIEIDAVRNVPLWLEPATSELQPVEAAEEELPRCDDLLVLAPPAQRQAAYCNPVCGETAHFEIAGRAELPAISVTLQAAIGTAALVASGPHQIVVDHTARMAGADGIEAIELRAHAVALAFEIPGWCPRLHLATNRRYALQQSRVDPIAKIAGGENSQAFEPRANAVAFDLGTPALCPRPRMGVARRYSVELRQGAMAESGALYGPAELQCAPPEFPAPRNLAPANCPGPNPAGLLRLPYTAKSAESRVAPKPAPRMMTAPQPPQAEALLPALRLEPLDEKPASDHLALPDSEARNVWNQVKLWKQAKVWDQTVDFWHRAPRDLKVLAFAIPLLAALALHPGLPKVRVGAPSAARGFEHTVRHALSAQLVNVRQSLTDRAAVALDEDFRSGLDSWTTRGNATAAWSFDATGFVRPGPLALYRPSMGLGDYQLQFLGMIDKRALSWVVRAADFDNFYVIKLEVLEPGPLPKIGMTRYAVINGKAEARADRVVPIEARTDTLYRVRLEVHGADFALWVQDQMVDAWSEARLRRGGVGFFSARGEQSRLRWVQVTHQYDMLGRLCAYLAPYNIPSTSGSVQ